MDKLCSICKMTFKNVRDLNKHIKKNHNIDNQIDANINNSVDNNINKEMLSFVQNHFETNRYWVDYLQYVSENLLNNSSKIDYNCLHLKCAAEKNPLYELINLIPNQWTFCFIKLKLFPDCLFMFMSDHDDGVYKRQCKKRKYVVNSRTCCVKGVNQIKKHKYVCFYLNKEPEYLIVDWLTVVLPETLLQNETEIVGQQTDINASEYKLINKIVDTIIAESVKCNWYMDWILVAIVLHEALKKNGIVSEIVKGFRLINNSAMFYCWVETNDKFLDPASSIFDLINEFKYKILVTKDLPPDCTRIDLRSETEQIDAKFKEQMIDLYVRDQDSFWENVPNGYMNWDKIKESRNSVINKS